MNQRQAFDAMSLNDEALLLRMISSRDEIAFRVFFDRYRKLVFNYANYWIRSKELAEEIMLDVFLKIWQLESPEEIINAEYFLRAVTKNMVISALRRKTLTIVAAADLAEEVVSYQDSPEEIALQKEAGNMLAEAVNQLPAQQRKVYELCRVEGLKYSQAAEKLALSPLTVKTHMQQALRFLRKYIDMHQAMLWVLVIIQFLKEKE